MPAAPEGPIEQDGSAGVDEPDLSAIRASLDDVDREMVRLLAERGRIIEEVIHFKRTHSMPVVDRVREDEMLARIGATAEGAGLDPRIARQVLRAVIDAFTLLEVEELGPDPVAQPGAGAHPAP